MTLTFRITGPYTWRTAEGGYYEAYDTRNGQVVDRAHITGFREFMERLNKRNGEG